MSSSQIKIRTEGFRAIGKSDILINGITVVAGENGCGKSTISKLLYYLYKTASNYESLVLKKLRYKLRNVEHFLEIAQYNSTNDKFFRDEFRKELRALSSISDSSIKGQEKIWISLINKISKLYAPSADLFSQNSSNEKKGADRINRLRYIIKDILKSDIVDNENAELPFDQLIDFVKSVFKEADGKIKSRPSSLFKEALRDVFTDGRIPKVFDVTEFEEQIVSFNKDNLSIPYLIQNVIYIDTPMMIGLNVSDNEYWNDLNELLSRKGSYSFSDYTNSLVKQIIHGDISIDDNSDFSSDYTYKRDDGLVFNLLDCATGVKAFAIIQLLIKNGAINDKTLLIIDEPESNLHPQWIIEYARLIVLLNKKIGTKFFIASHNPDMVSAIKYIAEKEMVSDNLNYYLAEKDNKEYVFNYKHLGNDIDPIFESFNIALDRITQYGS